MTAQISIKPEAALSVLRLGPSDFEEMISCWVGYDV
jgi:hypothetical protein